MIRQIFDRAFLLRHLVAFGAHLDQEIPLQNRGDEAAVDPGSTRVFTQILPGHRTTRKISRLLPA